jgi:hypothetical protein
VRFIIARTQSLVNVATNCRVLTHYMNISYVVSHERVFPANLHSICFSTIIFTITRGWHNRPGVAAVPKASQKKKSRKSEQSFVSEYRVYSVSIDTIFFSVCGYMKCFIRLLYKRDSFRLTIFACFS